MTALPLLISLGLFTLNGCETANTNKGQSVVFTPTETPGAHVKGDPFPDMSGRPEELIPGALPAEVRYIFADDATVLAARDTVRSWLAGASASSSLVFVNPDAWKWFKDEPDIGKTDAMPTENMATISGRTVNRQGMVLTNATEINRMIQKVTELLGAEEDLVIRAMHSDEMARWWPFIAFDITEPTFVVENKNEDKPKFILVMSDEGELLAIDALPRLPEATKH